MERVNALSGSREQDVFRHLEMAAKIGETEFESDVALDNVQTKSWHIRKAAEAAEIAGWPKSEIARRLVRIIEEHNYNISRRLVYHVCSPIGFSSADGDCATIAHSNSSLNVPGINEIRNEQEIQILDRVVDFLKNTVRPRLCENPYLDKILLVDERTLARQALEDAKKSGDEFGIRSASELFCELEAKAKRNSKIYEDDCFIRSQMLYDAEQAWDNRQAVNVFCQHELLKLVEQYNVAGGAQMYMSLVKDISLTPKQTHKYKVGEVRELLPIYDPKSQEEAIRVGYYGTQCRNVICKKCGKSLQPDSATCDNQAVNGSEGLERACGGSDFEPCNSWRVKYDKGSGNAVLLHCFACLATFKPETLALPRTESTVIDEKMQELFDKTYPQWKKDNKIE